MTSTTHPKSCHRVNWEALPDDQGWMSEDETLAALSNSPLLLGSTRHQRRTFLGYLTQQGYVQARRSEKRVKATPIAGVSYAPDGSIIGTIGSGLTDPVDRAEEARRLAAAGRMQTVVTWSYRKRPLEEVELEKAIMDAEAEVASAIDRTRAEEDAKFAAALRRQGIEPKDPESDA